MACEQRLQEMFAEHIIGTGDTSLQRRVVELSAAAGKRLATAESCTGGLIAALLTEVPGASQVFDAGFVTYSNRIKECVLGVGADTLARHGAVSEAVVRAMAQGALARSGADYAVAVSGIAGPDGGTPDKPVGTVWIAWGSAAARAARASSGSRSRASCSRPWSPPPRSTCCVANCSASRPSRAISASACGRR